MANVISNASFIKKTRCLTCSSPLYPLKRQLSVISSIRSSKAVLYMKSTHHRSKWPREPRKWPVSHIRGPAGLLEPVGGWEEVKAGRAALMPERMASFICGRVWLRKNPGRPCAVASQASNCSNVHASNVWCCVYHALADCSTCFPATYTCPAWWLKRSTMGSSEAITTYDLSDDGRPPICIGSKRSWYTTLDSRTYCVLRLLQSPGCMAVTGVMPCPTWRSATFLIHVAPADACIALRSLSQSSGSSVRKVRGTIRSRGTHGLSPRASAARTPSRRFQYRRSFAVRLLLFGWRMMSWWPSRVSLNMVPQSQPPLMTTPASRLAVVSLHPKYCMASMAMDSTAQPTLSPRGGGLFRPVQNRRSLATRDSRCCSAAHLLHTRPPASLPVANPASLP
mmetsp:Transcript_8003/g.22933  ORF Transcript_8003/g.22933 Transcript_8003/m.22933 type:complete len:395 (+) Transcript_8003:1842-3026(+)